MIWNECCFFRCDGVRHKCFFSFRFVSFIFVTFYDLFFFFLSYERMLLCKYDHIIYEVMAGISSEKNHCFSFFKYLLMIIIN